MPRKRELCSAIELLANILSRMAVLSSTNLDVTHGVLVLGVFRQHATSASWWRCRMVILTVECGLVTPAVGDYTPTTILGRTAVLVIGDRQNTAGHSRP